MELATNRVYLSRDPRCRYSLIALLREHGVVRWTLALSPDLDETRLIWLSPSNVLCSLHVPSFDAADDDWVRAANLLTVTLKMTNYHDPLETTQDPNL